MQASEVGLSVHGLLQCELRVWFLSAVAMILVRMHHYFTCSVEALLVCCQWCTWTALPEDTDCGPV
jgi:hypothetical protein